MPQDHSPSRRHRDKDSDEKLADLGAEKISEDDYFRKSDNFRIWLKEERGKYFDELSSEKARYYFAKFVKAWNRGQLDSSIYNTPNPLSTTASSQTAYKWSFASKTSKNDRNALEAAKASVAAETYSLPSQAPHQSSSRRTMGPSLPSSSDAQYFAEEMAESKSKDATIARKRARAEERDRLDDALGSSKSDFVGRDAQVERKRARREGDRSFREARTDDTAGFELGDDVLMGSSGTDSFKARIAARDAARERAEAKRQAARDERAGGGTGAAQERLNAMREKEKQTMEMFQNLAKQRYG